MKRGMAGLLFLWSWIPAAQAPAATPADVATVKTKLGMAVPFFNRVWSESLALRGLKFTTPKVLAYNGTITSGCGQITPGNAYYCSRDNTIYLDAEFLADLMRSAAADAKSDGDYAAIVVAAHEFGHLLTHQLGTTSRVSYNEEQAADCFAGAVTREARTSGNLEPGDLLEARFAMAVSGDRVGNSYLTRVFSRHKPGAHGSPADRHLAFNRGYYLGPQSCSPVLGAATARAGGRILFQDGFATVKPQGGTGCSVAPARGELVVTNAGKREEETCRWSLGNFGSLPDHFRLEVSVRQLEGNQHRGVGIFFGPPPRTASSNFAGVVRAEGSWALYELKSSVGLVNFMADSQPGEQTAMVARGFAATNRITLDVHREQMDATILLYINGKYVGMNHGFFGWIDRKIKRDDQIGLFVQLPGMAAAFSDFRMLALPE
jgi:predicted metalloprotease